MNKSRKNDPRDGWYAITPGDAQKFLDEQNANRPLNEVKAQRIASDIVTGRWRSNGETLIFDANGKLIDGQTRLRGCVIANKAIEAYCVFGVPYKYFPSLDQGRARSSGDLAALMGFTNGRAVAAVASRAILYAEGKAGHITNRGLICNDRYESYLSKHRERIIDAITIARKHDKGLVGVAPASDVAFVVYMVADAHRAEVIDFVERLATGVNLKKGDALLLFRERMRAIEGSRHQLTPGHKLALLIKTWNAFLLDRPVGVLRWNQAVEPFPRFANPASPDNEA